MSDQDGWLLKCPRVLRFSAMKLFFGKCDVECYVKIEEFVKEVEDVLGQLQGCPKSSERCFEAFRRYVFAPSVPLREALREAYKAVPEDILREYMLGDMDSRDGPIRCIIDESPPRPLQQGDLEECGRNTISLTQKAQPVSLDRMSTSPCQLTPHRLIDIHPAATLLRRSSVIFCVAVCLYFFILPAYRLAQSLWASRVQSWIQPSSQHVGSYGFGVALGTLPGLLVANALLWVFTVGLLHLQLPEWLQGAHKAVVFASAFCGPVPVSIVGILVGGLLERTSCIG